MALPRPVPKPNTATYQSFPPVPDHRTLTTGGWELVRRLMMAPALWPVQILAGKFGYPTVLAWLQDPRALMPSEAVALLKDGRFTISDLPPHNQVVAAMWGAILHGSIPKGSLTAPTLENKAKVHGFTIAQAIEANRLMESFFPLERLLALP